MNDGEFEPVGVRGLVLVEVTDPAQVGEYRVGDLSADGAGGHGVAEFEAEDVGWVDARVGTGQYVNLQTTDAVRGPTTEETVAPNSD